MELMLRGKTPPGYERIMSFGICDAEGPNSDEWGWRKFHEDVVILHTNLMLGGGPEDLYMKQDDERFLLGREFHHVITRHCFTTQQCRVIYAETWPSASLNRDEREDGLHDLESAQLWERDFLARQFDPSNPRSLMPLTSQFIWRRACHVLLKKD